MRSALEDRRNRGSRLQNRGLAREAQGLSVGPDKRRVIGAHPSRGTRVPMMQAANLRNRDDLAKRRALHVTRRRRVAIQRQMCPGIVIVGEVVRKDAVTDCLNTATCCRSARFSKAAARPMMNALRKRKMDWTMPMVCRSRRCEMGNPTGMHQDEQTVGRTVSSRSPQNPRLRIFPGLENPLS